MSSRGVAGVLVILCLVIGVSGLMADTRVEVQEGESVAGGLPVSTGPARYIVQLQDEPLATYRGGTQGLAATSPRVTGRRKLDVNSAESMAYRAYLAERQTAVLDALMARLGHEVKILARYDVVFNGMSLILTGDEAAELQMISGVTAVFRDTDYIPLTDVGPAWIGAPLIWNGTATPANTPTKGEGIIIGIIDTGINTDHPAFADIGGDGYDHTNPFGAGNYVGWCNPTNANYDPALPCNDKLIGLWDFADSFGESDGPEDSTGHGSHTASTAAGNVLTATITTETGYTFSDTISGVAPHANIIAYDACVSSCPGTALLNAVNQAVADGVDIINYSISGGQDPYNDAVELAFLAANEAGVFVSAAADNKGPGASTLSHQTPWVTTVGASTHNRAFRNTLINLTSSSGGLADITGKSLTVGYGPAPIVYAGDFGDALCLNPFPANTWTNGEIVVCDRGTIARVTKGENVKAGGAGGLVLANVSAEQSLNADAHVLPAVHVNESDGTALKNWLASGSNHMATILGTSVGYESANGDVMASFSSRGPNTAMDVVKPDVVAPGVDILAAYNTTDPTAGPEFNLSSGTSMAAPHVAGAAALVLAVHSDWTPDEVRSALMMTSAMGVVKEDGLTAVSPFDAGAGRIDLTRAAKAGLVLNETKINYEAANPATGGDPRTLNLPSMAHSACLQTCSWQRTVRSTLSEPVVWTVTVSATTGLDVTVIPSSFVLLPGATQTLGITADVSAYDSSQGWGFATVTLTAANQESLHMPVAVQKQDSSIPFVITKSGPETAEPGAIIEYEIRLDNLDSMTHTFSLTDTLPAGTSYVSGSATGGLVYDAVNNRLTWSGQQGPGTMGYKVTEVSPLPYINLGDLPTEPKVPNLCDLVSDCDDGRFLVDLTDYPSPYSYTFYNTTLTQISILANGLLIGPDGWQGAACSACPQPMPNSAELNQVIAPLWRDIDTSGGVGAWYGSVLTGLLANPADAVFYANWHDAGQFGDPNTTSRHAVAIVLDGQSEPAGRIYFIYDDISNRTALASYGFAIGVENADGREGLTYAFAPCASSPCVPSAPVGSLPANGTTLRLDPAIVGGSSARVFTYQVMVTAVSGSLLTNTVQASGDVANSTLQGTAVTAVGWFIHLPIIAR
ncbi:MAG: DUF11 domain-containing protein [Chloroflexi bacterium]|nr:MAG: DUF11 domain-containing protein [Chloroflexota bacterium]